MSRSEKAIFTCMCMVENPDGSILVQDRASEDWPGVTFPGGHVERGESFVEAAIREVYEETGLTVNSPRLCGIKQFQTERDERYVVALFRADSCVGKLRSSDEGEVFWVKKEELKDLKLAKDFLDMLEVFLNESVSEFYYYKEDGEWRYSLL